jgi:hypothetical protein
VRGAIPVRILADETARPAVKLTSVEGAREEYLGVSHVDGESRRARRPSYLRMGQRG